MINRFRTIFETALQTIAIALLIILSVIVIAGIVGRTLNHPIIWYDEVASILLAWLTYYGAALAALKRAHIGFPGLVRALPPRAGRAVRMVAETLVISFFGLLAYLGWRIVDVAAGDRLSSLPWMPIQAAQSVIPIGALLFILAESLSLPAVWRGLKTEAPGAGETDTPRALIDGSNSMDASVVKKSVSFPKAPAVPSPKIADATAKRKVSPAG